MRRNELLLVKTHSILVVNQGDGVKNPMYRT